MARDMTLARGDRLADLGQWAATYALAIIFLAFGAAKFGAKAGESIAPLVMNSPFVSWWHTLFGVDGTALVVGVYEILTGLLIAARPFNPRLSMIGGAMAVMTFLVTLSFLFSTPKVDAMLGEFLLKDLVLLGVALWVFAASRAEARASRRPEERDSRTANAPDSRL